MTSPEPSVAFQLFCIVVLVLEFYAAILFLGV
jgi:hypothetical protein